MVLFTSSTVNESEKKTLLPFSSHSFSIFSNTISQADIVPISASFNLFFYSVMAISSTRISSVIIWRKKTKKIMFVNAVFEIL